MNQKRKVRGLLDLVEAEMLGEDWEIEESSPDFVFGMGTGATKEATRWAYLGMLWEQREVLKRAYKRPAHRPKKHPYLTKDATRAFSAWKMCRSIRASIGKPFAEI